MPKEYTFTPRFKLIVDHLKAVRTLDEYVNGVGLKKDMQGLANYLQQELSHSVLNPAGWEDLYATEGSLYSSPKSKWRVVRGDVIAVEIYPDEAINLMTSPVSTCMCLQTGKGERSSKPSSKRHLALSMSVSIPRAI